MLKVISLIQAMPNEVESVDDINQVIELYKDLNEQLDLLLEKIRQRKNRLN